ncbi:hypothetical protein Acr_08g0012930 [Actinidia rufa]|uniref:Uncharacterized protein n=1 Tax=Actinidia rufa TaxID=165716 RepID=A0A7J0F4N6_9ERIC|nr:hypothetical protein Acr_08g0012930 [Actinidia rufa]
MGQVDKCLWNMVPPQNSSWTVRKDFELWDNGHSLIKDVMEDGNDTFLWLDNCHPIGPFYRHFGEEVVRDLGCSLQARVSSIICNGDWVWPLPRQRNRAILHNMSQTLRTLNPLLELGVYVPRWAFIDWFCCWGRMPSEWSIELDWVIHNLPSVDFENNLYKLVMAAAVYHIWGVALGKRWRILVLIRCYVWPGMESFPQDMDSEQADSIVVQ